MSKIVKPISIIGCGWLGLALAKDLLKNNLHVIGTTTSPSKISGLKKEGIMPICYELGDDLPTEICQSDIIIITIPPRVPDFGSRLKKVMDQLPSKAWVIFISSTSVYADQNCEVYEEDAQSIASKHTGLALLDIEDILWQSGKDTTIIRFAGLFGPDRHPGRFLAGKQRLDGASNPINLIHQEDCIGVTNAILTHEIKNEVFNACANQHPNRADFYHAAAVHANLEPPTFTEKTTSYKIINSSKVRENTGYSFKFDNLYEALAYC